MVKLTGLLSSCIVFACVAFSSSAFSQNSDHLEASLSRLEGTLNVQAQPNISEGKIIGCQFIFEAITRDWIYRQGGFTKVSGSVGIMGLSGTIGTTVKVVVHEMDVATLKMTRQHLAGCI